MATPMASKKRPPRTKPAEHRDRAGLAYQRLRKLIVWGRLAPGARIVEADVASRLGVSRTPVRTALHRLQQEGYIAVSGGQRQSRLMVAPLTKEDARELLGILAAVEGLAARGSAELAPADRCRLATELEDFNADLLRLSREPRPVPNAIFDADEAFHRCYVQAGAGPRVWSLREVIKPQAERYVRLYINALVGEIGTSVEEHDTIIQAIRGGDAGMAQRAVQTNYDNAAERLSRVIDSLGERGSW